MRPFLSCVRILLWDFFALFRCDPATPVPQIPFPPNFTDMMSPFRRHSGFSRLVREAIFLEIFDLPFPLSSFFLAKRLTPLPSPPRVFRKDFESINKALHSLLFFSHYGCVVLVLLFPFGIFFVRPGRSPLAGFFLTPPPGIPLGYSTKGPNLSRLFQWQQGLFLVPSPPLSPAENVPWVFFPPFLRFTARFFLTPIAERPWSLLRKPLLLPPFVFLPDLTLFPPFFFFKCSPFLPRFF